MGRVLGWASLALVVAAVLAAAAVVTAARPDDERLAATADRVGLELDAWWLDELRARGHGFLPVRGRITDGDDGMTCDGEVIDLDDEDLFDNAFAAWCEEGMTIAYDPYLFGDDTLALEVVLAHEWGHVVQYLDPDLDELSEDDGDDPAVAELQADCYGGAWAAQHLSRGELERAEQVVGALGDPADAPQDDADGHGTVDERVAAFRLGVEGGLDACLPAAFEPR